MVLFDGTSLDGWEQVGPGRFVLQQDGSMVSEGGMGLLFYAPRSFRDFVLELEYRTDSPAANSGIFVRFPERPADPWDAVRGGYEIQIDDRAEPIGMTGSIYSFAAPSRLASRPVGEWNEYRIRVAGQRYEVWLNGEKVNDYFGSRGREGFIGLQNHDDASRVHFRNIRVTPLQGVVAPESLGEHFATRDSRPPIRVLVVTATHGFRHGPAIAAAREVLQDVARTTEFDFRFTEDAGDLNQENLAGYDLLFFANSTLRMTPPAVVEAGDGATFDITLETNDGPIRGQLVLPATSAQPAGSITVEGYGRMPFQEAEVGEAFTTFAIQTEQFGRIQGRARVVPDGVRGMLTVGGSSIPLTGTRATGEAPYVPVAEAQRQAISTFVRGGKGIAVAHSGLDALYGWDEYREMVGGGLFESHPWTQPVRIAVEAPAHPAVRHFDDSFWLRDEIYVLDRNPRETSHVLLRLDLDGLGDDRQKAPAGRTDFPLSWVREHHGGRVFVTALGHFPDVWRRPAYVQHLLEGMRYAVGRAE